MPVPLKSKDKASGRLSAGISASTLSIPLGAGEGANFPQPYSGTTTSVGTSTTLNCTSIGSSGVAAGDWIHNVTDDSWARVISVSTNSLTTTVLKGGTANTWGNSQSWRVNELIATFAAIDASGNDTKYEEALISGRTTDTLVVATGGRGYNGTVAQTFNATDYVQLRVVSPYFEELKGMLDGVNKATDTNATNIASAQTEIDNGQAGTSFYVAAAGSSNAFTGTLTDLPAAYTTGERFTFLANHTISGSATFNRASLGAKTLKKRTSSGLSNLTSGDIQSGDMVEVQYDGTNYQILSHYSLTIPAAQQYVKPVFISAVSSSSIGTSSTAEANFDTHTYSIAANDLVAGVGYRFEMGGDCGWGAGTFTIAVKLGSTQIVTFQITPGASGAWRFAGAIFGTAAAGGSVAVRGEGALNQGAGANAKSAAGWQTTSVATNGSLTLQFSAQYGTSNGSNSALIAMSRIDKFSTSAF